MIRRITLAAVLLVSACGDDSEPKTKEDAGSALPAESPDAATPSAVDAGRDAEAPIAITPDAVTNVGATCKSANACMGVKPSCQTMLSLLGEEIPFPSGYCSAPCTENRECGASGECPVGESLKNVPGVFRGVFMSAAPSNCYERCTQDSECRTGEGYRCTTIVTALSEGAGEAGLSVAGFDVRMFLTGPIVDSKYCLPPDPLVPVGSAPDAGGSDAGSSDAGASDAAANDAGDASHDL